MIRGENSEQTITCSFGEINEGTEVGDETLMCVRK